MPRRVLSAAGDRGRRQAGGVLAMSAALLFGLAATATSAWSASPALTQWRQDARQVRILADNDAPKAHAAALKLQATLPKDATATEQVQALNLLARSEIYLAMTEQAAGHAAKALDLAKRSGDRAGQAEADLNIELNSVNEGKIDQLIAASTDAIQALRGLDRPDLLAEALLRSAMTYRRVGQIDDSVKTTLKAYEIGGHAPDPLVRAYANYGQAVSYQQSGHDAVARGYFEQMRIEARRVPSKMLEAYALNGLAATYDHPGGFQTANALDEQAVALFRQVGTPFGVSFALYAIAQNHAQDGRCDQALPLLGQVIDIYERHPNRIGLWFSLNLRATCELKLNARAAALADAKRSYAIAKDIGFSVYESESAKRLAALYAATGDHRRAYTLSAEAADIAAKAEQQRIGAEVLDLAQRYEAEAKQRQIDALTLRNQQQSAKLQRQTLEQRWLWTLLAAGAIALVGGTMFILQQRRSQRELQAVNARLQASEAALQQQTSALEQRVQERTAELRLRARYLRTLFDTLPASVWLKDTESRYLAVNESCASGFGLAPKDMVGKSDLELRPGETSRAIRADDAEVMASRARRTAERRVDGAGVETWIEIDKAPVLDEDGAVLGIVGVSRDVSARKAVEAAREAALDEAMQLAQMRSEFMAQISHELRTPLNAILGYAQILRRDRRLSPRQTKGLETIEASGQHLLTLINDILDLSRIEADKLDLQPVEVALAPFLRVVGDIIRVKAEEKGLAFSEELGSDLPAVVVADDRRLRQVLLNLLGNAVKFTDAGAIVLRVMRAESEAPPAGTVSLRFEIEDTGFGITANQIERIFQPFEQAGEALRREGGAGLGLAISRELVRLMGGAIEVTSEVGQGSLFFFELNLPLADSTVAAPATELGRQLLGYGGPRRRIMIVDDVLSSRAMMCDALAAFGFEVSEARTGLEAMDLLQERTVDLVVMDTMMPVMDGLEATRRIRADPRLARTRVIAVTASASGEDRAGCLAAGADAFVAKPVAPEQLMRLIAEKLGLELVYESSGPVIDGVEDGAPPRAELDALHALALEGYMGPIRERAEQLMTEQPRYQAFAARLVALADDYQSKAILGLIERAQARIL